MTSGEWDSAPDPDALSEGISSDDVSSDAISGDDASVDDVLVVDEVVTPEVRPSPDAVLPVWEPTGNADAASRAFAAVTSVNPVANCT